MAHIKSVVATTLLLFLHCGNTCSAAQSEAEAEVVLEVPAMGRMAQLGEFYDATDDTFLNQLIFLKRVPKDANLITTVDNPSTETKFQVVEGMNQKLTFLGIAASIAVTLKTGGFTIDVKGAASYVKDEKHSAKYVEGFLVHKTETSRDSIDLFYEGIRPYVDVNTLMETTATHVVTGIYNGADVAARFTDKNQLDEDRQDIKGRLEIAFSMQTIQVSGSAEVNITNGELTNSSTYELQVSGDVPMETIPRNSKEVIEFIKTIPTLLENINEGKGKPIRYVLTPLHELQKVYQLEYMKAKIAALVDEAILAKILETFEQIGKTRQKLNDLQDLFDKYVQTCMTPSIKRSLDELSNFFDATAGQFTADIRNGLVGVRNNTKEMEELQVILNDYNTHVNASAKVNIRLENDFEDGKRKIQFYEAFLKHMEPEQYMTESTYEADLIKTDDNVFYVLFYNLTLVDADIKAWEDGTYIFFNQLKRLWSKLKVVDCDFALQNAHCSSLNKTKIYSFISNRKVSSDVLADYYKYQRYSPLRIPAIQVTNDETYDIGHMFNATGGRFIEASILNRKNTLPIKSTDPTKRIKCEIFSHSNKTILEALNVPGEKHIPILLQRESLNGAGLILNVAQEQTMERLNLICVSISKKRWIDISSMSKGFFDSLDLLSLVDRKEATHFVQAREHTLNGIVSLETKKTEATGQAEATEAVELLRRKLGIIKSALEVNSNAGGNIFTEPGFTDITVRLYTDLYSRDLHNPNNKTHILHNILEQFKSIQNPENLEQKGSPLYTLHPIPTMQTQYGLITEPRHINTTAGFPGFSSVASYFDYFESLANNITANVSPFGAYMECIPKVVQNQIKNISLSFSGVLHSSKNALQTEYDNFLDDGDSSHLQKPIEDLANVTVQGELSLKELVEIGQDLKEKMKFYDTLKTKGPFLQGTYITIAGELEEAITKSSERPVYLLFFRSDWMKSFRQTWIENLSTFFGLFVQTEYKGYVVDCEIFTAPPCDSLNRPVIQEYNQTEMTSADLVLRMKSEEKVNQTAEDRLEQNLNDHMNSQETKFIEIFREIGDMVTDMDSFNDTTNDHIMELQKRLRDAEGSPPPLDAIYVQYNQQTDPSDFWNGTSWMDISATIPGVFGKPMKRYK